MELKNCGYSRRENIGDCMGNGLNGGIQWYYRGSLKSCNYSCSYCPFSKKKSSEGELRADRRALVKFVDFMIGNLDEYSAVMIVPYGEALIHKYYWEELARLSRHPGIELVGAQSNLSFPLENMLEVYGKNGGDIKKLRLWGTFHPDMVSADSFVDKCKTIMSAGIKFCVGCVGAPENIPVIKRLREELSDDIYLWVNKMDGLGRGYTPDEKRELLGIDRYFGNELHHYRTDTAKCTDCRFVESSGEVFKCNLARKPLGNIYTDDIGKKLMKKDLEGENTGCDRKECSCYIAYCNLHLQSLWEFEPYPAFRVKEKP